MKDCIDDLEMNQLIMNHAEMIPQDSEAEINQSQINDGSYVSYGFEDGEKTGKQTKGIYLIFK